MSKQKLQYEDFVQAAAILGCDVAAILAVDAIESRGTGFYPETGEPVILFERHQFHNATGGRFSKPENVNISNPVSGGYKGGIVEHARLQAAAILDEEAALRSTSWGRFQIMGFNYKLAGFDDLQSFINAMYHSEQAQLNAFVNYIKNTGLVRYMNAKDWAGFAMRYNGRAYAKNKYDIKLRQAYQKFKNEEANLKKANRNTEND